jgi:hypothetical protein
MVAEAYLQIAQQLVLTYRGNPRSAGVLATTGRASTRSSNRVQRMQKVLTQMNIQLAKVISNLSGLKGQTIVRAILAGERDSKEAGRGKSSPDSGHLGRDREEPRG